MTVIDRANWPRREIFEFFSGVSYPFFSVAFPMDVTELRAYTKQNGLSFYHSLAFFVTQAMNGIENFRYEIRGQEIILHDARYPSFTTLKPGSDSFQIITLPAGDSLPDFCARAKAQCAAQTVFLDAEADGTHVIYLSCLPWFPITALTHERDVNPDDSIPRVAWGKYEEQNGRFRLTVTVECNHRLVDGLHIGRFYDALRALISAL